MKAYDTCEPFSSSFQVRCGASGIIVLSTESPLEPRVVHCGFSTKEDFLRWADENIIPVNSAAEKGD